jgi:hypothetical protein
MEDALNDTYRFHPWRSPGSAPVTDACGTAGGTTPALAGPGDTYFSPEVLNGTKIALGGRGSEVLPPGPSGATWKVGTAVEVKWGLRFNHGGGYQYRLCPASEPLNEDCFQRYPLEFVRDKAALEFKNGSRISIEGVYIDEGVIPVGES